MQALDDRTALDAACLERLQGAPARRAGKIVGKAALVKDQPVVTDLIGQHDRPPLREPA
jgi:hypothetical protein